MTDNKTSTNVEDYSLINLGQAPIRPLGVLSHLPFFLRWGCPPLLFLGLWFAFNSGMIWIALAIASAFIAVLLAAMMVWHSWHQRRVEIDESGVRVYRGSSIRYFPFDQIGGAKTSDYRHAGRPTWIVWQTDGEVIVSLPVSSLTELDSMHRATEAITLGRRPVPHNHIETRRRLKRKGMPVTAWIASLKQQAQAYRSVPWDEQALMDLAREPSYPIEERAGATVVLWSSQQESLTDIVRKMVHDSTALPIKACLQEVDPSGDWLPKGIHVEF